MEDMLVEAVVTSVKSEENFPVKKELMESLEYPDMKIEEDDRKDLIPKTEGAEYGGIYEVKHEPVTSPSHDVPATEDDMVDVESDNASSVIRTTSSSAIRESEVKTEEQPGRFSETPIPESPQAEQPPASSTSSSPLANLQLLQQLSPIFSPNLYMAAEQQLLRRERDAEQQLLNRERAAEQQLLNRERRAPHEVQFERGSGRAGGERGSGRAAGGEEVELVSVRHLRPILNTCRNTVEQDEGTTRKYTKRNYTVIDGDIMMTASSNPLENSTLSGYQLGIVASGSRPYQAFKHCLAQPNIRPHQVHHQFSHLRRPGNNMPHQATQFNQRIGGRYFDESFLSQTEAHSNSRAPENTYWNPIRPASQPLVPAYRYQSHMVESGKGGACVGSIRSRDPHTNLPPLTTPRTQPRPTTTRIAHRAPLGTARGHTYTMSGDQDPGTALPRSTESRPLLAPRTTLEALFKKRTEELMQSEQRLKDERHLIQRFLSEQQGDNRGGGLDYLLHPLLMPAQTPSLRGIGARTGTIGSRAGHLPRDFQI